MKNTVKIYYSPFDFRQMTYAEMVVYYCLRHPQKEYSQADMFYSFDHYYHDLHYTRSGVRSALCSHRKVFPKGHARGYFRFDLQEALRDPQVQKAASEAKIKRKSK